MSNSIERVITVYNRYLNRGGEDEVFEAESDLLEKAGIEVLRLEARPAEPETPLEAIRAGSRIIWSPHWRKEMEREIDEFHPDLIHVHNWFPTMSPSIFWAAKSRRVPLVVTLHNFRLTCVRSTLYRAGHVCELCVGLPAAFWGVVYGCYQQSRSRSAVLTLGQMTHRLLGTWRKCVDIFITPSGFARDVLVRASFPADRFVVKPNFLPVDPGMSSDPGSYMFFAGRLSEEKGIRTLLAAARMCPDVPFVIVGNGPLDAEIHSAGLANVDFLGRVSREQVIKHVQRSRALVLPSEWYEGFPLIAIEAFASGRPIIGSRLGSIKEIVADQETGVLFQPAAPADLAQAIHLLWTDKSLADSLGTNARQAFEDRYTSKRNLTALWSIYEAARKSA